VTDSEHPVSSEPDPPEPPDLDAIERDLDDVNTALGRLADDSYWNDEVSGEPIPAEKLEADPLSRRA